MEGRPAVLELRLKNYKSVAGAVLPLNPLTVLIGPNGSGKSNILNGLGLIADALSLQLPAAISTHGGLDLVRRQIPGSHLPPWFGAAVKLGLPPRSVKAPIEVHYGFVVGHDRQQGYAIKRERCVVRFPDGGHVAWFDRSADGVRTNTNLGMKVAPHALLLQQAAEKPWFQIAFGALTAIRTYVLTPRVMAGWQADQPGRELGRDGRNIAGLIKEMQRNRPDDYQRLCALLRAVVPAVQGVSAVREGENLGLRFAQQLGPGGRSVNLDAASVSQGTLRVLGLLAAVYQRPSPLLMAIEEPEAILHPGAMGTLLEILKVGIDNSQLLITTHSPDLLDRQELDPECVRLVHSQAGVTQVAPIGPTALEAIRQGETSIGQLMRSGQLAPEGACAADEVELFPAVEGVHG
ncbi:MAG: AAA family ATPase [Mycobacterium leprae]